MQHSCMGLCFLNSVSTESLNLFLIIYKPNKRGKDYSQHHHHR